MICNLAVMAGKAPSEIGQYDAKDWHRLNRFYDFIGGFGPLGNLNALAEIKCLIMQLSKAICGNKEKIDIADLFPKNFYTLNEAKRKLEESERLGVIPFEKPEPVNSGDRTRNALQALT